MSTYKLTYFDARGVVEVARIMFAAAGQPYEDQRFPLAFGTPGDFSTIVREEFDAAKAAGELDASCGKVPILTVNGTSKIGQSKAIERFLARELGLAGNSSIEAAVIDALTENVRDIKDAYNAAKRAEDKDAQVAKFFAETLPEWCQKTEKSLPESAGPWLVGDKISHADIVWYNFVGATSKPFFDNVEGAQAAFANCPRIAAAMDATGRFEGVAQWFANRPDTMF